MVGMNYYVLSEIPWLVMKFSVPQNTNRNPALITSRMKNNQFVNRKITLITNTSLWTLYSRNFYGFDENLSACFEMNRMRQIFNRLVKLWRCKTKFQKIQVVLQKEIIKINSNMQNKISAHHLALIDIIWISYFWKKMKIFMEVKKNRKKKNLLESKTLL